MDLKNKTIRIGTRSSKLALVQAELVSNLLIENGFKTEIVPIKTTGDKYKDKPLCDIGGKMLFAKEIQQDLLDDKIDLAVHSLKDLDTQKRDGIELTATLKREDPTDVFITRKGFSSVYLDEMKPFVFGTCSPRRAHFMKDFWPNSNVVPLRGNVESRLQKVLDGDIDATILAGAGLQRLDLINGYEDQLDFVVLDPHDFVPAVCQGIIGVEAKENMHHLKQYLNHDETFLTSDIQRKVIHQFGGDCYSAIGVLAKKEKENIFLFIRFLNEKTQKIEVKKFAFLVNEIDDVFSQNIFSA